MRVGRGVPDGVVDSVEDTAQRRATGAQDAVDALAEGGRLDLGGVARAHGGERVGEDHAGLQEVDLAVELEELGHEVAGVEVEDVPVVGRETALEGEVVEGEDGAQAPELRIERGRGAEEGGCERGLPLVDVQHVGRLALGAQPLERGTAEEGEALGVVGVVLPAFPVEAVAVEVAVGAQQHGRDGRAGNANHLGRLHAARDRRVEARAGRRRADGTQRAAVSGDAHRHLDPGGGERGRQRGQHVGEAPRLGVRIDLGREHHDAHRGPRRPLRRWRRAVRARSAPARARARALPPPCRRRRSAGRAAPTRARPRGPSRCAAGG